MSRGPNAARQSADGGPRLTARIQWNGGPQRLFWLNKWPLNLIVKLPLTLQAARNISDR